MQDCLFRLKLLRLNILSSAVIPGPLCLLGKEARLDIGDDATLRECDPCQQFVELLVISYRQQNVAWSNSLLLVVTAGVSRELQDLCAQVFQDS